MWAVVLGMVLGCGGDGSDRTKRRPGGTEPTGDTAASVGSLATGDTGTATGSTGATASTGDTGPVSDWDTSYRCEALGGWPWIEDIPVPGEACTYEEPLPSATPGVVAFIDAIATARITGDVGGQLGTALALLDDVDGDGTGELAIGRPGIVDFYGHTMETEGEVWYFPGLSVQGELQREDVPSVLPSRTPDWDLPKWGDASWLTVGDLTGDGRPELVVGGAGYNPTFGVPLPPPAGEHFLEDVSLISLDTPGGYTFDHPTMGDVDGDGQVDLLFAGHGSQRCSTGGAVLVPGPMVGGDLQTTYMLEGRFHVDALDPPGVSSCSGEYGSRVLWDLDGDGDDEVLVSGESMRNVQPTDPKDPQAEHGGFAVFDGGPRDTYGAEEARAVVYSECSGQVGYGGLEPVGDVTGDGQPDLAVGAYDFGFASELGTRGAVFVASELHRARGTVPLSAVSCATIFGDEVGNDLFTAGYVGDLDGDGFDDLAVADQHAFGMEGAVYLFRGPVSGLQMASEADVILLGDGGLGKVVRGGVDLDGDGLGDLVVSAAGWDGVVYMVSGADVAALFP